MEERGRKILIYLSYICHGEWSKIYQILHNKEKIDLEKVEEVVSSIKCGVITILDDEYPRSLEKIPRPPFVLYYYGDISLLKDIDNNIGIVGARKSTFYGENKTREIVEEISKECITVSGMALGIDTIVAKETIKQGGRTIAVLGSGIDYCYPYENLDLYKNIKENQLLISEYPGNQPPDPNYFRMRNRIVVGLSKALLVTEAYKASGTLISVSYALYVGKEVMCLPYRADDESECNRLIQEGATLVQNGNDVLFALGKKT